MSYQFESRVRYSEVDSTTKLSLSAIVNYLQDCSTFQSEILGGGLEHETMRGRAWFLLSWNIEIDRVPELGEKIIIETWPYGFERFLGQRNYAIKDESGKYIVRADSVWVYMDIETGSPTQIDDKEKDLYPLEPALDMEYRSRKVKFPQESIEKEPFRVLKYHLDTNNHVNNGQYIQMAQEYIPENFNIHRVCVEYRKAAVLHDVIVPRVSVDGDVCKVALCDENRKPYAIIALEQ